MLKSVFVQRRAASLVEVVIVIAILGILFALVSGGIHKVRTASLRLHSENNLRQISLAFHTYCAGTNDTIKGLPNTVSKSHTFYNTNSVFGLLTQVLMPRTFPTDRTLSSDEIAEYQTPTIAVYLSPADPSLHFNALIDKKFAKISYAVNMTAFDGNITFPFSLPDGTSSTISFAERYWYTEFSTNDDKTRNNTCYFDYSEVFRPDQMGNNSRRATFADRASSDVYPVSDGNGRSVGSVPVLPSPLPPGKPFAFRPPVNDSWCDRLQTPHPAGLPVAMFDGSVRTLNPNIDERIFWSLVTPAGGEVVGDY